MVPPVVHSEDEIFEGFVQHVLVHGFVSLLQNTFGSFASRHEVVLDCLVLGLLVEILITVSHLRIARTTFMLTLRSIGYLTSLCIGFNKNPSSVLKSVATGCSETWILSKISLAICAAFL